MRKLHLTVFVLLLLGTLFSCGQPQQKEYLVDVQAHRGGMALYPEESLEAMLNAIDLGVNTLEMDVCVTQDRQVVLSHDKYFSHRISTRPDGTPVLEGEPREYLWHMPYDSVAKYDVGLRDNPDFPDQQHLATPKRLLSEEVAAIEAYTKKNRLPKMRYNIEIKCDPDYDGGIEGEDWPEYHEFVDICMPVLDGLGLGDRLIIQTFDPRTLNYINEAYPGHHLSYLLGGGAGSYEQFMGKLDFIPEWLSPAWQIMDAEMVDRAHADGMKVVTWTVDAKDRMRIVIDQGADAVISNYPDRLMEVVAEYESPKGDEAYVFTYFDNSRQDAGLFLAYSWDGYHWTSVNGGDPIMEPCVGDDGILRDPSVCRGPDGIFHLVWTISWNAQSIGYARSEDLIHWSGQKVIPAMEAFPSTRNTWAPELFYEASEDLFYIFWASTVPDNPEVSTDGCISESNYNHRIYCTTTRDFETFSPTWLYFNPPFNVIDACVARIPETGELLMALKNENLTPPEKNIRLTRSKNMAEGFPVEVSAPISGEAWSEGPTILPIGGDLLIYFDKFREHRYGASLSHDGGLTWEDATDRIGVPAGISHGTALAVPAACIEPLHHCQIDL